MTSRNGNEHSQQNGAGPCKVELDMARAHGMMGIPKSYNTATEYQPHWKLNCSHQVLLYKKCYGKAHFNSWMAMKILCTFSSQNDINGKWADDV
jgi:hypothetical protein